MQKLDAGPRVYQLGQAVATLSFTPLADRAAILTNLKVVQPSANDDWLVSVAGRELMRFRILTGGSMQFLDIAAASQVTRPNSIFDWMRTVLGQPMDIPVPQGTTITVSSLGGATATVVMELMEVGPTDVNPGMVNHYLGNTFVLPITGRRAAAVANAGLAAFDTVTKPAWVPDPFTGVLWPVGIRATFIAAYFEAEGVNTFSGAANHQSIVNALQVIKDGQQLFTRGQVGIPAVGAASNAGSANTVFGTIAGRYRAFQMAETEQYQGFYPPLQAQGGDLWQWFLNITGDVTGGADYSSALLGLIALVQVG